MTGDFLSHREFCFGKFTKTIISIYKLYIESHILNYLCYNKLITERNGEKYEKDKTYYQFYCLYAVSAFDYDTYGYVCTGIY